MSQVFCQIKIDYLPSDENFTNPERGFYSSMSTSDDNDALNANQLINVRLKKQTLILREYYITKYAKTDLDDSFFNLMVNDFKLMREQGVKCILRFAYSDNIGVADASLNMILEHLDQLAPYLEEYSDVIAFMQAGFIGAWGEWHSSQNGLDNTASRKKILEKILSVLPVERMVQVRTPYFKKSIFNKTAPVSGSDAFSGSNYSRVGHHNDCFLADETDMGTYSDTTSEKNYISNDALYVPVGGETCSPSGFCDCPNTVYQMGKLHWTYLNNDYNLDVIGGWKTEGCLDTIKNRLGYRYELLDGEFTDSTKPGGAVNIKLKLRNVGFASLYNPRKVEFILRNQTDTFYVKLNDDPRLWQSGDTINIEATVALPSAMGIGNYSLLLNMPDVSSVLHDNPLFSIRMANTSVWESKTGYNDLNVGININPSNSSPEYSGDYLFRKLGETVSVKNINTDMDYHMSIRNYPNPFNGTTILDYSVPEAGMVNVKIYNILGQLVSTVVDEYKPAGNYKISFNSESFMSGVTSGVYFYVLSSNNKMCYGKMVLLK